MSRNGSEAAASSPEIKTSALLPAAAAYYWLTMIFQGKIATLELGAFLTILCVGWALARGEIRFSAHILYLPLLLYGVVSTISSIAAPRSIHAWGESMLWFKMLIFPAALVLLRELSRLPDLLVYAHAIFAFYVSAWGLGEFFLLDQRDLEHRINGPASHVMTFSGLLLPLSLMLLILWWHQRKLWQLAVGSLASITLLLTFTRSVWLGWAAAMLVLLIVTRIRLAFFAVPVALLFLTFLPLSLFGRLVSTFNLEESSNFDRLRMAEAGVEMIRDFPILGVGPGNVKESYALYRRPDAPRPRPPHLHNNAIQLWAERGVLGLAAYLLLLGLFLRECVRGWRGGHRMWAEVGVAVVVSLTVAGLFEFNFGDTEVFYLLLNLMVLVIVQLERARLNEDVEMAVAPTAAQPVPV